MIDQIVFGTRGSSLALFQTDSVISKLKVLYPDILYKRKVIKTQGDKDQDSSLNLMEELGLFSNEIQSELVKNNIGPGFGYIESVILSALLRDKKPIKIPNNRASKGAIIPNGIGLFFVLSIA